MQFEADDLARLALGVRQFLLKADAMTRLSAIPVLYLELPDVGTMHAMHCAIAYAVQSSAAMMRPEFEADRRAHV